MDRKDSTNPKRVIEFVEWGECFGGVCFHHKSDKIFKFFIILIPLTASVKIACMTRTVIWFRNELLCFRVLL